MKGPTDSQSGRSRVRFPRSLIPELDPRVAVGYARIQVREKIPVTSLFRPSFRTGRPPLPATYLGGAAVTGTLPHDRSQSKCSIESSIERRGRGCRIRRCRRAPTQFERFGRRLFRRADDAWSYFLVSTAARYRSSDSTSAGSATVSAISWRKSSLNELFV